MSIGHVGIRWTLAPQTGWGVFAVNLAAELVLQKLAVPVPIPAEPIETAALDPAMAHLLANSLSLGQQLQAARAASPNVRLILPFPVLHGLGNGLGWSPVSDHVAGSSDIGVVFLEDARLEPDAIERAARFQRILAGSSWVANVLRNAGIRHVAVSPQGVDTALFHPGERRGLFDGRFVIFTGGKLEFRKAQDLVVAAFARFRNRHPEALLLTHWHSPYGSSIRGAFPGQGHASGSDDPASWLAQQGIPADAVLSLGPTTHAQLSPLLREADVALFPNRAEGGTNLVAMECLASGVPTILSANTGHLDLLASAPAWPLTRQRAVRSVDAGSVQGWGESDIDEIVDTLERIHAERDESHRRALRCADAMADWSWRRQMARLWRAAFDPA